MKGREALAKRIKIDGLADAVSDALNEYSGYVSAETKEIIRNAGKTAAKHLALLIAPGRHQRIRLRLCAAAGIAFRFAMADQIDACQRMSSLVSLRCVAPFSPLPVVSRIGSACVLSMGWAPGYSFIPSAAPRFPFSPTMSFV